MPHVLLAEADRDLRDRYVGFLSGRGHCAETADSGLQCVAKLRHQVPDLLVLDLDLPWGGGDGVLGFLREEPQFLPDRIVLTSSADSARTPHGLTAPPVVQALTKPFSLYALLEHAAGRDWDEPEFSGNRRQRPGILVVDDEPAIRKLLSVHLHHHGYRVWTAPGSEEALDHCCDHGNEIAAVLLEMPGLDGAQTLEGIRAFDSDLPVCFMTNDSADEAQGARQIFRKPFGMDEMVRVLRNLTRERAMQPYGAV